MGERRVVDSLNELQSISIGFSVGMGWLRSHDDQCPKKGWSSYSGTKPDAGNLERDESMLRLARPLSESNSGPVSSPATPTHNLHWKCLRMKVFVCCASSE